MIKERVNSVKNIRHSDSFPGAHPNNITSGRVQAMIRFYGQGTGMGNKSRQFMDIVV